MGCGQRPLSTPAGGPGEPPFWWVLWGAVGGFRTQAWEQADLGSILVPSWASVSLCTCLSGGWGGDVTVTGRSLGPPCCPAPGGCSPTQALQGTDFFQGTGIHWVWSRGMEADLWPPGHFPWLPLQPFLCSPAPPSPASRLHFPPSHSEGAAAWLGVSISAPSASCPVAGRPLRKVLESARPAGPGAGCEGLGFPPPGSSTGLPGPGTQGVRAGLG